jgi:hypothetical protein
VERQDSRRAGAGTGEDSRPTFRPELRDDVGNRPSDRELLEEIAVGLRRLRPLVEAAERHPIFRALLRR